MALPEISILNARSTRPRHEVNTHVFHCAHPLIASRFDKPCRILSRTRYPAVRRVWLVFCTFRFAQPFEQQGKPGMSLSDRMNWRHLTFKDSARSRNEAFALNLTALKIRPLGTFFEAPRARKPGGSTLGRLTAHKQREVVVRGQAQGLGKPIGTKSEETDPIEKLIAVDIDIIRTQQGHSQHHDETVQCCLRAKTTPRHGLLKRI